MPAGRACAQGGSNPSSHLYIQKEKFHAVFAADLPESLTRLMAAGQRPVAQAGFGEKLTAAAWHDIPSWFVVSKQDKAIAPDLERFEAARGKARTVEVDSSHVSMMSHPDVVVRQIRDAAGHEGRDGRDGHEGTAPAELAATGTPGQALAALGAASATALAAGAALTRLARRSSSSSR
ncbi:alpha/beta fold hydrolase [Kitasatospora sp. NPDC097605]|uniref:alpha/beta fold hydrolase n=1 Tax=Kitasatospora sp. NPDC097605 TaxID=3157226 RepID=UPI003330051B